MRPRSSAATWMTGLPATGTRGNLSGVPGLGSSVGVTIAEPPRVVPEHGRAMFFVVEPDRECLVRLERRIRDGRLRPPAVSVRPLAEALTAFDRKQLTIMPCGMRPMVDGWVDVSHRCGRRTAVPRIGLRSWSWSPAHAGIEPPQWDPQGRISLVFIHVDFNHQPLGR